MMLNMLRLDFFLIQMEFFLDLRWDLKIFFVIVVQKTINKRNIIQKMFIKMQFEVLCYFWFSVFFRFIYFMFFTFLIFYLVRMLLGIVRKSVSIYIIIDRSLLKFIDCMIDVSRGFTILQYLSKLMSLKNTMSTYMLTQKKIVENLYINTFSCRGFRFDSFRILKGKVRFIRKSATTMFLRQMMKFLELGTQQNIYVDTLLSRMFIIKIIKQSVGMIC